MDSSSKNSPSELNNGIPLSSSPSVTKPSNLKIKHQSKTEPTSVMPISLEQSKEIQLNDLLSGKIQVNNRNARDYLEASVFGDVRESIKDLLRYIQQQGELDRFWGQVEKKNEKARRKAVKVQNERRRLEQGSAYNSSDDENQIPYDSSEGNEISESNWSATTSEWDEDNLEEDESEHLAAPILEHASTGGVTMKSKTQKSRMSKVSRETFEIPFNPLRYLAMQLQDKNQTRLHILKGQTRSNSGYDSDDKDEVRSLENQRNSDLLSPTNKQKSVLKKSRFKDSQKSLNLNIKNSEEQEGLINIETLNKKKTIPDENARMQRVKIIE